MMHCYGIYRACRDSAWRCQLDFGVSELPVMLNRIAKEAGIRIVKNSDVNELRSGELGVSISDGDSWTIVYDNSLPAAESRFVVAHEIGHIFLGHGYKYEHFRFERCAAVERAADQFAMRLLAPAFALHELKLTDPDSIAELCRIPIESARIRAKRIRLLDKRGSYYKSPLECRLYERFGAWLENNRPIVADCTEIGEKMPKNS